MTNRYSRGTNNLLVEIAGKDVYFSYDTIVAVRAEGRLYVRQNEWGPTTGRHLNDIDGGNKADRMSGEDFEKKLEELGL